MIINTHDVKHIYVATNFVDMRQSIDGLAVIVSMEFDLDVLEGSLFIFTNKARNRMKILSYEQGGFWLLFKRLEQGTFKIYEDQSTHTKMIDGRQLRWVLEGLEMNQIQAHKSTKNRLMI